MIKIILSFLSISLTISQAFSFSETFEVYTNFENDLYWQKLMHYQPSISGFVIGKGLQGQADGGEYYFSKDGNWSLVEEAKASVLAFQGLATADPNAHPQCRFPERYRYLKEKLKFESQDIICPDFIEWMESLDPIGAALVFASNFPNNPGSAMGHTFLKIISRKTSRLQKGTSKDTHLDLLDYSISYAASTFETKGLGYAMKGLLGGFQGQFSMQPYYLKVREYSEGEGRDLWEYELNIDEQSVRRMLSNFWEVSKNTYFDYYFLDENCSFHMLTMLDIAKPDWNLSSNFPLYTIPYETIKALSKNAGAIKDIKFRPSLPKRSHHIINQLSQDEQTDFQEVLVGTIPLEKYALNARFLEALINYIYFQKIENQMRFSIGHEQIYNKSLVYRAKLGANNEPFIPPTTSEDSSPDQGQGSSQVLLTSGFLKNKLHQNLNLKGGLHDLISRDAGFAPETRLNLLQFNIRRFKKNNKFKIKLDEFVFIDSLSLIPITEYEKPKSWGIRIAYQTPKDKLLFDQQTILIMPSAGYSMKVLNKKITFYGLAQWQFEYAKFAKNNFRTGPSAVVGTLTNLGKLAKVNLEYQLYKNLLQETDSSLNASIDLSFSLFLSDDLDLRILLAQNNNMSFLKTNTDDTNYFYSQAGLSFAF